MMLVSRVSHPDMWSGSKLPDFRKITREFICEECSALAVLISISRFVNTTESSA